MSQSIIWAHNMIDVTAANYACRRANLASGAQLWNIIFCHQCVRAHPFCRTCLSRSCCQRVQNRTWLSLSLSLSFFVVFLLLLYGRGRENGPGKGKERLHVRRTNNKPGFFSSPFLLVTEHRSFISSFSSFFFSFFSIKLSNMIMKNE